MHSGEIVCVIEDITEKTFIENENKKLEAINRLLQKKESLNRMAGAIAHHFNNKLGAIIGNLELAIYDMSNEGVPPSKHVLGAMSAASKASEVSSSMLTYLGQKPGKRIPINLSESCLQCLSVLKAATPDAILFKVDLLSPGPVINADTTQVQQILTNLVTNSLEALEGCFGSIHVTVQKMSPADIPSVNRFPITWKPQHENYACMEVRDSGSGIAAEDFEKIFDPFFTSKFTGRGLGLPVILGITQAHQGVITVESKKNQGSVFMVFFPIYQED